MARRILIQFPADRPPDYYYRVWIFADELYGRIVTPGLGCLNDIDRARELIWIDLASKRHLGTVKGILKKELQRHHLDADATVTTE